MRVSSGMGNKLKTALITGASGGIGRAVAEKLAKDGYFIIAQYNSNPSGIELLLESLDKSGLKDCVCAYKCDLSDSASIDEFINEVKKSFKSIDVIVNNAGVGLYKLITDTTDAEWDKVFSVNMKSAFKITNGFLKEMIVNQRGKIVNISSMWGLVGASMEVAYSASKSALIGYTKALAKELAPSGINVNCVCPGVIDTPINARFSKEDMAALKDETPLGRIGKPKDVAELVAFLCSDNSDFITGQIIACDGGFTL